MVVHIIKEQMKQKKYCKHNWKQIDKKYKINDDGLLIKVLIDQCKKCSKIKER